ncbi:hypothetical protein J1N35_021974 [Gossypium stocksii]|uniref:Uncharacterized protein n=1 Tax=Gossypium stocksii TaxID=47602 RepID=A0A9D3VFR1_9ROSI|nr:hypothetical protein J1N35_021974 [Gossypium stocksii]
MGEESYLVRKALEFIVVEEECDKRDVDPLDLQRFGMRSGVNRVERRALEMNHRR